MRLLTESCSVVYTMCYSFVLHSLPCWRTAPCARALLMQLVLPDKKMRLLVETVRAHQHLFFSLLLPFFTHQLCTALQQGLPW